MGDAHRPLDPRSDWDNCWAGEGVLVCWKRGNPDRLGLCDLHFEELTHDLRR